MNYRIILASGSPRRKELLAGLGYEFEVKLIPGIDESYPDGLSGEEIAMHIARQKAVPYKQELKADELVITADTIVYLDGKVLGKPADVAEAHDMLRLLSGKKHNVITGVSLLTSQKQTTFASVSDVTFAELSDEEIDHYIKTCHPTDKAGAYGIQEWIGYIGVTRIEGSYFNVMGLPVQRLYTELKHFLNN